MKYIDTNILVRLITGDNPELFVKALNLVESAGKGELYVDDSVLTELCFILEFHQYQMKREVIADAIIDLLNSGQMSFNDTTPETLNLYRSQTKLDFVDCLLVIKSSGDVMTFDKYLLKYIASKKAR